MPSRGLTSLPLPSRWVWAALGLVHCAALFLWGSGEPRHDGVDYIAQGQLLAAWVAGNGGPSVAEVVGRLALHNPGYAALVAVSEALTGRGELIVRAIQCAAGILSGFILFAGLRNRVGASLALTAACVLWFHPAMIFFRLSLWPVALATLGTTALGYWALTSERPVEGATRTPLHWGFGWTLAILPFFASPALALLPAAWLLTERGERRAAFGPTAALWLPWTLALSLTLGSFTAVDLSASRNLALGNHPAVSEGRGSLWGDPEAKRIYLSELNSACPGPPELSTARCEHGFNTSVAADTLRSAPFAAAHRALLRLKETWRPGTFLPREFKQQKVPGARQMTVALGLTHFLLLSLALLGIRTPQGRAALSACLLWTLPVLFTVGFTRLRQPTLPFLLIAASFGIRALTRDFPEHSGIIRGLWRPIRTNERTEVPARTSPKPVEGGANPILKRSTSSESASP